MGYELADAATVAQRGMQAIAVVTDPSGNRHELCWGHLSDCQPFLSPQGVPRCSPRSKPSSTAARN